MFDRGLVESVLAPPTRLAISRRDRQHYAGSVDRHPQVGELRPGSARHRPDCAPASFPVVTPGFARWRSGAARQGQHSALVVQDVEQRRPRAVSASDWPPVDRGCFAVASSASADWSGQKYTVATTVSGSAVCVATSIRSAPGTAPPSSPPSVPARPALPPQSVPDKPIEKPPVRPFAGAQIRPVRPRSSLRD